MARYITLSKAARLVGVKRGTLQKRIRAGELSTFEGELDVDELLRAYPNTQMEDNTMIERVERFMEQAFAKAMRAEAESLDIHTLAKRIGLLSQELAAANAEVNRYAQLVDRFKQRVAALEDDSDVAAFKSWFLHALEGRTDVAAYPQELLAKEAFLRIMAAHVRVMPSGHDFFVEGSADLLEGGLSAGLALHYGCSDGSCGRCKARLVSGEVREIQEPLFQLSEKQLGKGEMLLCCNTAVSDVVIEAPEYASSQAYPEQTLAAHVKRVSAPVESMSLVQLEMPADARLEFLSGQRVRLETADGSRGEFSLASCPCDETKLEFHVYRDALDDSAAAFGQLTRSDVLTVVGPQGDFVLGQDSSRPLVMIAVDAGFAPIKGLIEHAVALDLVETIDLFWVDTGKTGHYLGNLCRSWSDALDIFSYHPLTAATDEASVVTALMAQLSAVDLAAADIYVAGSAALLPAIHAALLARGADAAHVHEEVLRQGASIAMPEMDAL